MGENTKIEWCHHTFNSHIGCSRVSEGCRNCYAEALSERYKFAKWGNHNPRRRTSAAYWRKPLLWNRKASESRERHRVFCASLADVFDEYAPDGVRPDLFKLIKKTPNLDWLLLTKRPQNIPRYDWRSEFPNVWLGVSTENQEAYDERWVYLDTLSATVRFISYEPALGPIRLQGGPDWVVAGGESGPNARTVKPPWIHYMASQCKEHGIPFFMKQWGTYRSHPYVFYGHGTESEAKTIDPPENGKGGARLCGKIWREFPNQNLPFPYLGLY